MTWRSHGWMVGAVLVAAGMVQVALVVARAVADRAPAAAAFRTRAPDAGVAAAPAGAMREKR